MLASLLVKLNFDKSVDLYKIKTHKFKENRYFHDCSKLWSWFSFLTREPGITSPVSILDRTSSQTRQQQTIFNEKQNVSSLPSDSVSRSIPEEERETEKSAATSHQQHYHSTQNQPSTKAKTKAPTSDSFQSTQKPGHNEEDLDEEEVEAEEDYPMLRLDYRLK